VDAKADRLRPEVRAFPVACTGRGEMTRESRWMPELNHWPHGPAGVLAIILEAVPAWLYCRFSWASKRCSLWSN